MLSRWVGGFFLVQRWCNWDVRGGFCALDGLFLVFSIERMDPSTTLRAGSPPWKGYSVLPAIRMALSIELRVRGRKYYTAEEFLVNFRHRTHIFFDHWKILQWASDIKSVAPSVFGYYCKDVEPSSIYCFGELPDELREVSTLRVKGTCRRVCF